MWERHPDVWMRDCWGPGHGTLEEIRSWEEGSVRNCSEDKGKVSGGGRRNRRAAQMSSLLLFSSFTLSFLLLLFCPFENYHEFMGLPWWLSGKVSAASAGDTGSIPNLGRCHMPRSRSACVPRLLSLWARARERQPLSLGITAAKARAP